jgi:Cu(I)/Ag(I) efflux system protein CusF
MKRLVASTAVLALFFAMIPLSRAQGTGGMDMGKDPGKQSQAKTHKGTGTVTKVDPTGSKVTIAHGPVQTLKWPAMTMTFGVKDKAMLDKVKPGANVEFGFVQSGKDYTITDIK